MLRSEQNLPCTSRKRLLKFNAAAAAAATDTPKRKRGRPAQDLPALRPEDVVRPVLKRGRPATPIIEIPWSSFSPSPSPSFSGTIAVKEVKRGRPPAPPYVQPQQQNTTAPIVVVPIVKRGRPPSKDKSKMIAATMKQYSNAMPIANNNHIPT